MCGINVLKVQRQVLLQSSLSKRLTRRLTLTDSNPEGSLVSFTILRRCTRNAPVQLQLKFAGDLRRLPALV